MDHKASDEAALHDDARYPLDKVVFGVAAAWSLAFVVWGVWTRTGMATATGDALAWVDRNFGWLFVLDSGGVRGVLRLPGAEPLRQHQARARTTPSRSSARSPGCR